MTGSIKIKTAVALVEDLEQRGVARPGETVFVESSSGNLGLALSLVCAIKGYEFICVTDPNANRAAVKSIELYGAKVIVVTEHDSAGGYLGSRLERIDQILTVRSERLLAQSICEYGQQERSRQGNGRRDHRRIRYGRLGICRIRNHGHAGGRCRAASSRIRERQGRRGRAGRLRDIRRPTGQTKDTRHRHECAAQSLPTLPNRTGSSR